MDLSKKIGALISANRKVKNISQEELADVSGLHPDYIGKIERGERNPCELLVTHNFIVTRFQP